MRHHDLIVVGTGSGNSIPDERFADLDIAIIDDGTFGGTCINVGCIPTKMFVHTADLAAAARGSSRLGVDSHVDKVRWTDIRDRIFGRVDPISVAGRRYRQDGHGTTFYDEPVRFVGPRTLRLASGDDLTADRIVLATGSRAMVPAVPGLETIRDRVHTSDTIMRIDSLPESIVILGGGVIAAEMAGTCACRGRRSAPRQPERVSASTSWLLSDSQTQSRPRATSCSWRPDGCRTPTGSRSRRAASPLMQMAGSSSTSSSAPRPTVCTHSVTSAALTSSSTWPTTGPASFSTTCCILET